MSKPSITEQTQALFSDMYTILGPEFPKIRGFLLQAYKDLDKNAPQVIIARLTNTIYQESLGKRPAYPQQFEDDLAALGRLMTSNGYGYVLGYDWRNRYY